MKSNAAYLSEHPLPVEPMSIVTSSAKLLPNPLLAEVILVRSCSEICMDANNNADNVDYLTGLWKEIAKNKHKYPIVQLRYIQELLEDLLKIKARQEANELKKLFKWLGLS